jgi:hypothetical protein
LRVEREWSTPGTTTAEHRDLTDGVLASFYSRGDDDTLTDLPFIYDGTPEMQETFRSLLLSSLL